MVIGNVASDTVDTDAARTKERVRAAGGIAEIVRHLGSDDPETLFYACGACMNCCTQLEVTAQFF